MILDADTCTSLTQPVRDCVAHTCARGKCKPYKGRCNADHFLSDQRESAFFQRPNLLT
jgi:hypothetical protein